MTIPPSPTPSRALSPKAALLLSALVLPGLGQLVTGRLLKGALMALVPLLWLPLAFIKVLRDLFTVMPELSARATEGAAISLAGVREALRPMSGDLWWLMAPLAAVWLWSLVDSLLFLRHNRTM